MNPVNWKNVFYVEIILYSLFFFYMFPVKSTINMIFISVGLLVGFAYMMGNDMSIYKSMSIWLVLSFLYQYIYAYLP